MSQNRDFFTIFSTSIAQWTGKPVAFALAFFGIIAWAIVGPVFHFSETWQLVVNTATTIVTFLMVFILQNSQNRDGMALQAKLDELILASKATNRMIGAERLGDEQLKQLTEELEQDAKQEEAKAKLAGKRGKVASTVTGNPLGR